MSIPHALLALLAEQPKFGLRLKEEFEARTGSVWPLNVGQVYTTLNRLERDGLISNEKGSTPSRKLYELTTEGRSELMAWLSKPPSNNAPPRNELVIKVMVAITIPGVDVLDVVQTHRRHQLESMQDLTKLKRNGADLALLLVVDAELFRLEANVRWLDTCDTRLRRGDQLPATHPNPSLAQSQADQPVTS